MNHALSRLHLTIKKGANFTADAPLSKITLKGTAIDATGTMDLTTGAITASKKSGETGTVELPTDGIITAEGIEKDILLVPADNSEGKKDITLILTIGGKLASVSLSGENGIDIRSGIQNNVTLTVEDTGIKVSGVGVGEWGEGFSQQVEVHEHKVIVKLDNKVPGINEDVLITAYAKNGNAIIEAFSKSDINLGCVISGNAKCTKAKADNIYTFTISDITSDITATIGYQHVTGISLNKTTLKLGIAKTETLVATIEPEDACNKKIIWSSGDDTIATVDENGKVTAIAEGEAIITATTEDGGFTAQCTVTVAVIYVTNVSTDRTSVNPAKDWVVSLKAIITPEDATNKNVTWFSDDTSIATVDENGNVTAIAEGVVNITVTTEDGGKTATCQITVGSAIPGSLSHEFSVSSTKKVHFSKGNLYCSGVKFNDDGTVNSMDNAKWGFEENQYETASSRDENHISHFMWCVSPDKAMSLRYDDTWYTFGSFFAGENFTVNGYKGWSLLKGDHGGELEYLLYTREGNRFAKAKVHNMNGLLIFPDGYSLPSGYSSNGGTGMSKVNDSSADYPSNNLPDDGDNKTWSEMEAAGVAFLPAAGHRSGHPNNVTPVQDVGKYGDYWSRKQNNNVTAYDFSLDGVNPYNCSSVHEALTVRLVVVSK